MCPAVPIWVDTRTGNPDPFVTRVGIAPQVDFTSWQAARLSLAQINNSSLGGESGDADHDGEDNFSEFRSRTDPNNPSSVVHSARELNFSTRLRVQTGNNVLIGGFIITGTTTKSVILRAIGPSLSAQGISGALQDPTRELRRPTIANRPSLQHCRKRITRRSSTEKTTRAASPWLKFTTCPNEIRN